MLGQDSDFDSQLSPSYLSVMRELFFAWRIATEVGRPPSDFAVEIDALTHLGATYAEIRYLLCKGYAEHRIDGTRPDNAERIAVVTESLQLTGRSCFLLTPQGIKAAKRVFSSDCDCGPPPDSNAVAGPHWDALQRTFTFDGNVAMRFDNHAPAQEQILAAFEEEGWRRRIDDPLPPNGESDPKRRLNKTIHRLNNRLRATPIRFCSDGSGEGIC